LVAATEHAELGTIDGLKAWRELVLTHADHTRGKGGCLGLLVVGGGPDVHRDGVQVGGDRRQGAKLAIVL
jgi:hypothetical protein